MSCDVFVLTCWWSPGELARDALKCLPFERAMEALLSGERLLAPCTDDDGWSEDADHCGDAHHAIVVVVGGGGGEGG